MKLKIGTFCLALILGACNSSSKQAGSETTSPAQPASPEEKDESTQNQTVSERKDELKGYMDYCLDDGGDEQLRKTVEALKALTLEELCGISAGRLDRMSSIDLSGLLVSDIRPLRSFKGLKILRLSANQIIDLKPLAKLSSLEELYIDNNASLENLEGLESLSRLKVLSLSSTSVTSQSLESIKALASLVSLNIRNSEVRSLASLNGLIRLEELNASLTELEDLSGAQGLSRLRSFDASDTKVSNLSPLAGLELLETLSLENTPISLGEVVKDETNCPAQAVSQVLMNFCTL